MEVAFDSPLLRSICEDQAVAMKELGPVVAEILKHRLADIRAASTLTELPAGHLRVAVEGGGRALIDLGGGYTIDLEANHRRNPTREGGDIEWGSVSRVKVMRIGHNND